MQQRLWIVAAIISSAVPVGAQPDDAGATAARFDAITAAELEKAIGGRSTLALHFKDLTVEEVTKAVAKASELPFTPPSPSPWSRVTIAAPPGAAAPTQPAAPTYDADVDKIDFWLALRTWGRAETLRLKRAREVVEARQKNERPPAPPVATAGQPVAPELVQQWQQKQSAWVQNRVFELRRLDASAVLSAHFNAGAETWNLEPGGQLFSGYALNSWPCLVLANGFQRIQNLSMQEPELQEKIEEQAATDGETPLDIRGRELLANGYLTDALALNLAVYVEPKLMAKAKIVFQVDEARDDAGEDLLTEREKNMRHSAFTKNPYGMASTDSGIVNQIQLRPRRAQGKKLAILRGKVSISYPTKFQEHEITNFAGAQNFSINTSDLPTEGQLQPPTLQGGRWQFDTEAILHNKRGRQTLVRDENRRMWAGDVSSGILGYFLLPDRYTFTDSQGRTWRSVKNGGHYFLNYPDGLDIPITSPPTPLPDEFTYTERAGNLLQLVPQDAPPPNAPPNAQMTLPPDELAKVRFTKATFITESDWRSLEVPFEFHDLPLPPR